MMQIRSIESLSREELMALHLKTLQQQALTESRTDYEIVEQTEQLARILLLAFYGRDPQTGFAARHSRDPRSKLCWEIACQVQMLLTATDAENAAQEVDA